MTDFEFILVNIYLLSIFTLLIKTKTITQIYRFLKIFIVIMFIYLIVEAVNQDVDILMLLLVGLPLVLLIVTITQAEVLLIMKKFGLTTSSGQSLPYSRLILCGC